MMSRTMHEDVVLHSAATSRAARACQPLPDSPVWIGVVRDPDGLLCAGWSSWSDRTALSAAAMLIRRECLKGMGPFQERVPA